ncbi:hypothetical protein SAMN05660909_04211 [Chitinophaga terrae (ex Kim and Jung 2007)]|uniref:Uncharacterized protein n=1 Tax=Chitinophaga terrae (ex Kim and Jung 2007) TaxID=408074 RepID=A0A1H4F826_9BACT|nr:hypothetical protein [Chitinophaga terrae (ex Kim and Jung 2007)]GEP92332.1 hypothetical protein CTE07_39770 [Chitinophaga terrae (ex Kim and Jung 2007)]SEA93351.1 hypothetical protein SAMN05660909_04211 [Chitinophaga terrae (ex Kim and Jung 2007)]
MTDQQHLQTITDIKRMMERSSRFISLSGLSGVAAGICGLAGAFIAKLIFDAYYVRYNLRGGYDEADFRNLKLNLVILGLCVLLAALGSGAFFTLRRVRKMQVSVWDMSARKLLINILIPLVTGGFFIAGLIYNHADVLVAPTSLIFYGLALINASKYTLSDVRYLGLCEIVVGLINLFFLRKGLYFWAIGFGVLHIVYGILMWWKYERKLTL